MKKMPVMFDLDGTLFQAHLVGVPAYRATMARLCREGLWEAVPQEFDYTSLFGKTEEEIWTQLLPGASRSVREQASCWMEEEEVKNMGRGRLYPGVQQTLAALAHRGHSLFVVSNGTEGYVRTVCRTFGLSPLLAGIYSAGEYNTATKAQLLALAIKDHALCPGLMVGDRSSDIEAGQANGFVTVACTYGYGKGEELAAAQYHIDHISQVIPLAEGSRR